MMWYFDNIIRPDVIEAGERFKVPIRYASAERWKSVQKDGVFRDIRGRVILPVMVMRRHFVIFMKVMRFIILMDPAPGNDIRSVWLCAAAQCLKHVTCRRWIAS